MDIHFIQQTPEHCVSACIAMLTGQSLQEVVDDFHNDLVIGSVSAADYLEQRGFKVNRSMTEDCKIIGNTIYLILAPSLNLEAEMHCLVLDARIPEDVKVYDPNRGRHGCRYYVSRSKLELQYNEVRLGGYVFLTQVEKIL